MEETKVTYYVDEEETPYLMKISQSPGKVTLADFKGQLNRPYHKFFFKAMDDDIGYAIRIKFLNVCGGTELFDPSMCLCHT